jgi:hypothetical protein
MAVFSGGGEAFPPLFGKSSNEGGYWVSIETVDYEKKATELSILTVKSFMKQHFNGTRVAKPTKEGKLILQAVSKHVGLQACKVKEFPLSPGKSCKIAILPMESMNHKVCSIYGRELLTLTVEEIEQELRNQKIIKVERAQTMKEGILTPNGLHILTFDAIDVPNDVYIGYMRYNLRTYYPRPLRCSRCCIFGHSKKRCNAEKEACRNCDKEPHIGTNCEKKYCRNCKKYTHCSFDKECPIFEMEVAIVRIKIDKNISYGQARAFLEKEMNRSTESYENSIFENLQRAARERAAESEAVKAAIIQNQREIDELKDDLKKLEEQAAELENLKRAKASFFDFISSQQPSTSHLSQTASKSTHTATQNTAQNSNANTPNNSTKESTQMETETNLKRKKSKSKEEIPNKRFTIPVTMHIYHTLTNEQSTQIKKIHKNRELDELIMYEFDETNKITARRPRDNAERNIAKKMLDLLKNEEEAELLNQSL